MSAPSSTPARSRAGEPPARPPRSGPARPPRRGGRRRRGGAPHAPAAGERAARLGSHKEAADQFERALRYADAVDATTRADLLERLSYESYLVSCIGDAIDARRLALAEHERARDTRRQGDAHRWLSRLAWYSGDNADAMREGALAVQLLEAHPPGRELAMAYSNLAQLRMLASDLPGATQWGTKAIALAEELDETETLVHALNNVGARARARRRAGREKLERSLALALDAGLDEHVARAFTNLGSITAEARDYARAEAYLTAGIAYCTERDLDAWGIYMTGYRARVELDRGRLDDARRSAESVLEHPGVTAPVRIPPLVVLGRIAARTGAARGRARRGEGARDAHRGAPAPQRRRDRAGRGALAGGRAGARSTPRPRTCWPRARPTPWVVGELALWRRRAGLRDDIPTPAATDALPLELADRTREAARLWTSIGCRYEAALARAHASDETSSAARSRSCSPSARPRPPAGRADAPGARRARAAARPAGEDTGEPGRDDRPGARGPRARRGGPAQRGHRGPALPLGETVAHHVSAILRKLDVPSRGQAGMVAARLGLVER